MRRHLKSAISLILQILGFVLLAIAGWTIHQAIGIIIAGISCFIIEWIIKNDKTK